MSQAQELVQTARALARLDVSTSLGLMAADRVGEGQWVLTRPNTRAVPECERNHAEMRQRKCIAQSTCVYMKMEHK